MRRVQNASPRAVVTARMLLVGLVLAGASGCPSPEPQAPEAAQPEAPAARPPVRLLLLLTADTLRADRLGSYGSDLGLTPHLDALARESLVFETTYAPAPFTLPSVSALFTSRYPEENGIFVNENALHDTVPTLATRLSEHGWRTGAVVSNFVLRRSSGLARGFDRYDDAFPDTEAIRGWPERIASHTADAVLAALEACTADATARCFLWGHFQDPHGPYTPPAGRRERLIDRERAAPGGDRLLPRNEIETGVGGIPAYQALGDEREAAFYRAGYHAEIEFLDEQVGRVLAALEERELSDRAVVVFTADHGEALGEDDVWFSHGERLHDPMLLVPLLLRVPGVPAGRRQDVASLLDVAPTLLALLERAPLAPNAHGRDLLASGAAQGSSPQYLSTLRTNPVLRYGLVEDGFKFVVTPRADDRFWDGRLTRPGREDVDLAAAAPQVARRMRKRITAVQNDMERLPERRQTLSEADVERLRALGYAVEP